MKHVRMHIKIPNIAFQSAVVSFCFLIFCCFAWVFTSFIKCNFCFGAYLLENQNRIDVRGCTLYIYMCLQLYIFFDSFCFSIYFRVTLLRSQCDFLGIHTHTEFANSIIYWQSNTTTHIYDVRRTLYVCTLFFVLRFSPFHRIIQHLLLLLLLFVMANTPINVCFFTTQPINEAEKRESALKFAFRSVVWLQICASFHVIHTNNN